MQPGDASTGHSGAALFKVLWDALVDLLGTAAAAALMRRAVQNAQPRSEELAGLTIVRVDGEYHYTVPRSFERALGPPPALVELAEELRLLLEEQTGDVALRHLAQVPELEPWMAAERRAS